MSAYDLVGAGGASLGALTSISSDLAVSVSFQVASELLDAAHETDTREDELIGMVLSVSIGLSALKTLLEYVKRKRLLSAEQQRKDAEAKQDLSKQRASERLLYEKSLLDFALLFVSIMTRIAFAVEVQLVAASARARQTSRGARILSLIGLAVFFVFVESSAGGRIV